MKASERYFILQKYMDVPRFCLVGKFCMTIQ
jgi:hypothetical protein